MVTVKCNVYRQYESPETFAEDLETLASFIRKDAKEDPERTYWIQGGIELSINEIVNQKDKNGS